MSRNTSGRPPTLQILGTEQKTNSEFAGDKQSKRLFHCHCGCGEQLIREEYLQHIGFGDEITQGQD